MITREMDGTIATSSRYQKIYPDWKNDNEGNLDSVEAVWNAGTEISKKYEVSKSANHDERAAQSVTIYNIMMGNE